MPILQIRVKPKSRQSALERQPDGSYIAHLKSLPVAGKANAELIALVAAQWACPKLAVTIKSGAGARLKLVQVDV